MSDDAVIRLGRAARLCTLPDAEGALILTGEGTLVAVHSPDDALRTAEWFEERAPDVWDTLESRWPGVRPGDAFPRFHLAWQPPERGYPGRHCLLDLRHMDIPIRARRAELEAILAEANADPEAFLRRQAAADVAQAMSIARAAEGPEVARRVGARVWARWAWRLE